MLSSPTWSEASSRVRRSSFSLRSCELSDGAEQVLEDQPDDRQEADDREVAALEGDGDAGGEEAHRHLDGREREVDLLEAAPHRLPVDDRDVDRDQQEVEDVHRQEDDEHGEDERRQLALSSELAAERLEQQAADEREEREGRDIRERRAATGRGA